MFQRQVRAGGGRDGAQTGRRACNDCPTVQTAILRKRLGRFMAGRLATTANMDGPCSGLRPIGRVPMFKAIRPASWCSIADATSTRSGVSKVTFGWTRFVWL